MHIPDKTPDMDEEDRWAVGITALKDSPKYGRLENELLFQRSE